MRLCSSPELADGSEQQGNELPNILPPGEELAAFASNAPPMVGLEYLNASMLSGLWDTLHIELQEAVTQSTRDLRTFLDGRKVAWNLVGRVCFHLAENKANPAAPFAFLATYSTGISPQGKAKHLPLGKALQEYSGQQHKSKLLQLLLPIQKASSQSTFIKELVDSGDIYHPLVWTPAEAFRFLKDIPKLETAGLAIRVPDWWKSKKPPRPQVSVTIGGKVGSPVGLGEMLSFSAVLTLGEEELSEKEVREILSGTNGLALIRGQWVEIDREKLKEVLEHWKAVKKRAGEDGFSFIEGMRLLAGTALGRTNEAETLSQSQAEWTQVTAGGALARQLEMLRNPDGSFKDQGGPNPELKATLRPYQHVGVEWLWLLNRLGLGGCLADDMGLGKTIQIISLLLLIKKQKEGGQRINLPSLLVLPASLIGNWKSEIDRFAPSLCYLIAHPSEMSIKPMGTSRGSEKPSKKLASVDLVITTYGCLARIPWLAASEWNLIVIDEAQAIKNAASKQTRAVKALKSRHRLALTGTPVENHLSDLWSLFDFLCPGLLGSAKEFSSYVKGAQKDESTQRYSALRELIRPYLLRRLKSDRRIISDLPDKTELSAYCSLSKKQVVLYQESVHELSKRISKVDGIQRRGLVLAFLMRFKQICNHPSQWLADGRYEGEGSGKFARLKEICDEIAAKQEKVLVFTQFKEMTGPLSKFLSHVFGREGLILHGEIAVSKRKVLVDAFQAELGPPFFVLSLKAGGTGLNLTAASHVIHFDRWWNPAVENQATDRAYRIGQKKNVLVHKFVCRGTIEERIDELISAKQSLSNEILEGGTEKVLTELSNDELIKLVSLDIRSAIEES